MATKFSVTMETKACEVTMTEDALTVEYRKCSGKRVCLTVPYHFLLAVEGKTIPSNNSSSNNRTERQMEGGVKHSSLILHYARPASNSRLRLMSLSVRSDVTTCRALCTKLQERTSVTERPKRLAVIINPNSGKKRAEKVFKTKVQPVFSLCGIHSTVTVTSAPKEARELLQTLDLGDVDGVVTVGGDGLYCEVMNGLLLRTQKDHGVNADDPEAEIIPTDIPIGIIPAGSGDWVVQYLHGTRDVITSALHVVLGKTSLTNAVSVHQGGKLSAYAGLVLGFGLQGDIMNDCEKFRWMGPSRYSVVPVSTVLSRQLFDVEVEYQDDVTSDVKRISDQMYGVDTYVISKGEQGDKLVPVFGDSALSVYTSSKCSLGKHVQKLTKLQENKAGCFDFDFVKTARTQGYKVRFPRAPVTCRGGQKILKEKYYINCDGEVLQVMRPEFEVRLHRHAIRLFGTTFTVR